MLVLFIGTFSDENSKNLFIYICLTDFSQKWQTEIHHFKNGIFRPFLGANLHPDDHFWGANLHPDDHFWGQIWTYYWL